MAEEKLLALFKLVHGEMSRSCYTKIIHDDNEDPIAVALMKGGQECWRATKTDLMFDYITKDL